MEGPKLDHLETSVKLGDPKVTEGLVSRHRDEFPSYDIPLQEPDYRVHGAATLSLADGTNHIEKHSAARSAYADPGPVETTAQSYTSAELQKSRVFVENNAPTPSSTQKSIYVAHPPSNVEPVQPPKHKLDLSQPHVDLKDTFKSSYQNTHRGEIPEDNEVQVLKNTFKSTISLDEGRPSEPIASTAQKAYTTPVVTDAESHAPIEPGRNTKTNISLGEGKTVHATTASTTYKRPPQEAISLGSPTKPSKSAWDSSVTIGDKERAKTPTATSREAYSPRPGTMSPSSPTIARAKPANNAIIGTDPVSYNTTASSTFQRPETPSQQSPSRRNSDIQRSNFALGSEVSPKLTSTSRTSYASPGAESSAPPAGAPGSPQSRRGRSNFSLGEDNTSYQSTARSMYSPPSATPNSPSRSRVRTDQISNVSFGDSNTFGMGSPTHLSSSRSAYQPHSPSAPTRNTQAMKSNFTLG